MVGTHCLNKTPKGLGVIAMFQMREFVDHHIVNNEKRSKNEPPGEVEPAAGTAGTKARFS